MMKRIVLILTCFLLFGFNSFANLEFDINNCEGSYTYQYSLDNRDSVKWELHLGSAEFTQGNNFLIITKATDGTVLKQLNYYDSRDIPITEYYTINLPSNCLTNVELTQAHVGLSAVDITPCDFRYTHQPETRPKTNELANWKLIEGKAEFNFEKTGDLTVSDATETSVFVYSITNESNNTSYDTLTIEVIANTNGCVDIDRGQNDDTVNCGSETDFIYAKVNEKTTTLNDNYKYVWSSPSKGIEIYNPNNYRVAFTINTSGEKIIKLEVYSQLGHLVGTSEIIFASNCVDDICIDESKIKKDAVCPEVYQPVCGCNGITYSNSCNATASGVVYFTEGACPTNNITQAHVGLDIARITPCQFSYTHQPETRPTTNETTNWKLIEGKAEFNFEKTGDLTVSDATNNSTFVYSITNGSQTTYDTLTLKLIDDGKSCVDVGIDQGQNDTIVNCGDSAPIFAIVSSPNKDNYTYVWSTDSEGITINKPNSTTTDFTITTSGEKIIELKVYSQLGNFLGASKMTFTSNCVDKEDNTFEINNCNLPYFHQYSTQPFDTVAWEVESGYAKFTNGDNFLRITEATDGTIILKKVYGLKVTITKYVINVTDGCSEKKYTVEGHVTDRQEMWQHGMIFLYDTSKDKFVDSVQFDRGIYLFRNVSAGTYTVYAVPYEDKELTKPATNVIPTYYVNKATIKEANTFKVTNRTFSVDVKLIEATTVSLSDFNETNVSVYPNPFSNELIIDFNQEEAEVMVSNIQGNVVYEDVLSQATKLNTSNWSSGVYLVKVKTQDVVKVFTVIK